MDEKNLSSLELAALMNELQFLIKGKISQIYHPKEREFLFQLHVPDKGKQLLRVIPGKFLNLTEEKKTILKPSGFCMQLRKYIDNAFIADFYQKDSERVVVFELEKARKEENSSLLEKFYLIIELFSKGNIILTKENYEIIALLERQAWKDRLVKPGEMYIFPHSGINWKNLKDLAEEKFLDLLQRSEKRNLAAFLATDIGFGGVYAEEICCRASISKDKLPKETTMQEAGKIIKAFREIFSLLEHPKGCVYRDQATPFPLLSLGKPLKILRTFNEAVAQVQPFAEESPLQKRINDLKRIIVEQIGSISRLEENIALNARKGELIYENYTALQKLLQIVKELRKSKNWDDIATELKKERKIKSTNLKNKKVVIDV